MSQDRSRRPKSISTSAELNTVLTLSNLDNVPVRIPNVAACLTVLLDRLRDELSASTLPQLIARLNIRHAEIHKAVDVIRVGHVEHHRRLIGRGPSSDVEDHPYVRELQIHRRAVDVPAAQNA